jgi:hypothetical protein
MERAFSSMEQSFSGMRTIVLRPENGSIGVDPEASPATGPAIRPEFVEICPQYDG